MAIKDDEFSAFSPTGRDMEEVERNREKIFRHGTVYTVGKDSFLTCIAELNAIAANYKAMVDLADRAHYAALKAQACKNSKPPKNKPWYGQFDKKGFRK